MKKIFTTIVLVVSVAAVHAQINYGARGGMAITSINGDGYSSKPGIHLGAFAQIFVNRAFSVQPEIYYASQGANWDEGGKTTLSYLHIPLLAKYTTASGFFGETGPQLGFLLSAYDKYDGEKEDVKEFLNSTDFSWAFGAGYQFNKKISVNARYNLGLSKFWREEKNSALLVGIHYTLGSIGR